MSKPYIICHMMTSVDGRIDCGMTAQLQGNNTYYSTLNAIEAPTRISGRVTAQTELSNGQLLSNNTTPLHKEAFHQNTTAKAYEIIMDTKGRTSWGDDHGSSKPHLIITSEQASIDYLADLDRKGISWIATGKKQIDLARAMDILHNEFGVERLAIVGGGKINGGFLAAGLIDEISIVIGPGADGRVNQPSLFDGRSVNDQPIDLKLKDVQSFDDGAVWLRYLTKTK